MANSGFLARLIGPVALAVGIGLFLDARGFRSMAEEMLRSRPLVFLSGMLSMTAGMAIILTHNQWVASWPVIITIVGWIAIISGAARIIWPGKIEEIAHKAVQHKYGMTIGGGVWLAVGAILTFFGFFHR